MLRAVILTFLALATLVSAAAQKPKHKEKIEFSYDKFQNISTLRLVPMEVGDGVYFGVASFAKGDQIPPVSGAEVTVHLLFRLYNNTWKCLSGCTVIFLVDGERLPLGTADSVSRELNRAYGVMESIAVEVNQDTFTKIANARSVEFQAGADEAQLKDTHLAALRDFASHVKPLRQP